MFFAILLIFIGILINAFGIFAIKRPTFGWRMSEGWKVKGDSEPSASYIDSIKFRGVFAILLGSLILVFGILALLTAVF